MLLGGTPLLRKYGGTLLGASCKDGNEGFFLVAFAVIDNEMDANLMWFLSMLGWALYKDNNYEKNITLVSNRSNGPVNDIV